MLVYMDVMVHKKEFPTEVSAKFEASRYALRGLTACLSVKVVSIKDEGVHWKVKVEGRKEK